MCSGKEFQISAAETEKARLPTVESLTGGTSSPLVPTERSARRPGTSAVEVNGPMVRLHGELWYLELDSLGYT